MKQHKWHKEIKAWADGAEIESRYIGKDTDLIQFKKWSNEEGCDCAWENKEWEFRIKPQPMPKGFPANKTPTGIKKPKYMYVYLDDNYELSTIPIENPDWQYIGKIKLED